MIEITISAVAFLLCVLVIYELMMLESNCHFRWQEERLRITHNGMLWDCDGLVVHLHLNSEGGMAYIW